MGGHAGSSMSRRSASFVHAVGSTIERGETGREGRLDTGNCNGLVLMAAARGQRSLLSAWGDFLTGTRGENCQSAHED